MNPKPLGEEKMKPDSRFGSILVVITCTRFDILRMYRPYPLAIIATGGTIKTPTRANLGER